MKSLVLFSNDLRLNDNEAICSAVASSEETAFIFIYDKKLYKETHGSANLWWLENSLKSLKSRLHERKIRLHIIKGEYVSKTVDLVKNNNIQSVFLNQNKHPSFISKEERLNTELKISVQFKL